MEGEANYLAGYAVIRIDEGPLDQPSRVGELLVDGVAVPAAGPSNVKIKEVVTTAEEAAPGGHAAERDQRREGVQVFLASDPHLPEWTLARLDRKR